jgi:hypothetical protein
VSTSQKRAEEWPKKTLPPPKKYLPTNPHKKHQVCAASKNVEDINKSLGKLIKQAAANQASRKSLLTSTTGLASRYISAAAAAFADGKLKAKAPAAPKK